MIGVSGSIDAEETKHYVLRDYLRAVLAAGGVPVLLSPDMEGDALESCLAHLNGLLLAGGNDISPRLFGGLPIEALGEVNPLRDAFEWRLIAQARARQMPVLGICRGIQAMNAALGGTLYQDLASQYHGADGCAAMKHQQTCDGRYPSHRVCVAEGTLLHRVLGVSRLEVNSFHHQAVWKVAPCLRVNATAEDGVTEGVECPELPFFLGVQWHPERVHADDARAAALFAALVRAARAYRMGGEDA
ncbi:MAG: gamma-glutamyl-gamma-aminobutyrate hydrolase family protein [Clostridia bacterium]